MNARICIFTLCFPFVVGAQQTPGDNYRNLQKYWNMRHQFLGDNDIPDKYPGMIEVGNGAGFSVPAHTRDQDEANCGTDWVKPPPASTSPSCIASLYSGSESICTKYGALFWGDGTIWMGDYIAMLATEWKLLDMYGYTAERSKTELELYYALQALNRLDLFGEVVYGTTPASNGYLARDDAPLNIYENFGGHYDQQGNFIWNYPLIFSGGADHELCPGYYDREPEGCDLLMSATEITPAIPTNVTEAMANAMSQDQVVGMLYGLSFVAKLIPASVTVSGTSLKEETQAIVTRIVNWVKNGEPSFVNPPQTSSGLPNPAFLAELWLNYKWGNFYDLWAITDPKNQQMVCRGPFGFAFSYPYATIAENITGATFHNGISETIGEEIWDKIKDYVAGNPSDILNSIVSVSAPPPTLNICFPPSFVDLCEMGLGTACTYANVLSFDVLAGLAGTIYCDDVASYACTTICGLGIMDDFCLSIDECSIINKDIEMLEYNINMFLKLAAASGTWHPLLLGSSAKLFKKEIYDLAGAVLNDHTPFTTPADWDAILNSAPCNSPCYNTTGCNEATVGWLFDQRWDNYLKSQNGNRNGHFNGIDYMLAYNLYRLAFPNEGGPYLPLIDRTIEQDFPYTFQGNQIGDDSHPLTLRAPSTIFYDGTLSPDANVIFVVGKDWDHGANFDPQDGCEYDIYYDYMVCEPNVFDDINTVVLRQGDNSGGKNKGGAYERPSLSNTMPKQQKNNTSINRNEILIQIIPNPNTGHFTVQSNNAIQNIEIKNLIGEQVYQSNPNNMREDIDLSAYPKGIYLVQVQSEGKTQHKKLVVQ